MLRNRRPDMNAVSSRLCHIVAQPLRPCVLANSFNSEFYEPTGLSPNVHLLSWGSNAHFAYTQSKRNVRSRASLPKHTISPAMLDAASAAVASGGSRRGGAPPMEFYEPSSKRCLLCDTILSGSYAAHESYVEHVARVGIVERAIALLLHHLDSPPASTADETSSSLDVNAISTWTCSDVVAWLDAHWWDALNPANRTAVPHRTSRSPSPTTRAPEWDACLTSFCRIPTLSADSQSRRMQRVRFLLGTLKDVGVLRYSLMATYVQAGTAPPMSMQARGSFAGDSSADSGDTSPSGAAVGGYARGELFQRFEMIGDNIMKVLMPDRLQAMFPYTEGGVDLRLQSIQRLLDSNQGLLDIYDALQLNTVLGTHLANSKAKSDVVEAIFGELQTYLWATDSQTESGEWLSAVPSRSLQRIRAVVDHTLNELMHVLLMWSVTRAVRNTYPLILTQVLARSENRRAPAAHRHTSRTTATEHSTAERLSQSYFQKVAVRPAEATVLPLLAPRASSHYLSAQLHTHREWWTHSTHDATTMASESHLGPQQLQEEPCVAPAVLKRHYAAVKPNGGARLHWPSADHREDSASSSFSVSPTPQKVPLLSPPADKTLKWELTESYPWKTPR